MAEVAKLVELVIGDRGSKLIIDGVEFPWHIASDGLRVVSGGWDDINVVEMSVLAERTEVRFENLPVDTEEPAENEDALESDDQNLADWEKELLGIANTAPVAVGHKFTMAEHLEIPDNVLSLKILGESCGNERPFLLRGPKGWHWSDLPTLDPSDEDWGPHHWEVISVNFEGEQFEIVNVK